MEVEHDIRESATAFFLDEAPRCNQKQRGVSFLLSLVAMKVALDYEVSRPLVRDMHLR